jgi:DNA-directed RNA polymerase subunit RPC12/RpoP
MAQEGELELDGFELKGKGIVRTEESCTECRKVIVAKINFDINGNHRIVCPHCGHVHFRVIKDGKMTGERWSYEDRNGEVDWVEAPTDTAWSNETLEVKTTSAHEHIRNRFLEKYQ